MNHPKSLNSVHTPKNKSLLAGKKNTFRLFNARKIVDGGYKAIHNKAKQREGE